VWHDDEYAKLPLYDKPTGEQPVGVFACHQQDGRVCAGWAGTHDMDDNLALRLAVNNGSITVEDAHAICEYETSVPLFATGLEAAEHGWAEIDSPGASARRMIGRLEKKLG
jgi:hypothetical protein